MSYFNNIKALFSSKPVMAPASEEAVAQFMRKRKALPDEEQFAQEDRLAAEQGAAAPESDEAMAAAVAIDAGAMAGAGGSMEAEDDDKLGWVWLGVGSVVAGAALAADHGHGDDKPAAPAPNIRLNTPPDVTDDHYVPQVENDALTTPEDTPLVIAGSFLLSNDTDVDGNPLTIISVQEPVNGTVSLGEGGEILFTPDGDFNGDATFTYTVSDGQGGTDTATVTILVTPVNDPPVIEDDHYVADVVDDALTTPEDTALLIAGSFLLDNDDDVEGPLTIDSVQDAVNGTVSLDEDGNVTFTPDENFNGEATFTYTASDSNSSSDTATVTILVTPVNDPPVGNGELPDRISLDADLVAGVSVAGAFSDADGDTLTYSATGLPPGLTLNADTGVISGTIDPSASDGTNDDNNTQVYTVTVTANDGLVDSAPVVFSWTVNNTIPEFLSGADTEATAPNADSYDFGASEGDGAGTLLGSVAAADADGDTRTYSIVGTDHGLFAINAGTGAITLTQAIDDAELGDYVLSVRVDDGEGGSDTATVNILLENVNDPPEGVQDIGVWVPSDPAEQTLSLAAYPDGYPIHIPAPTDVDSILMITATSVPAGVYYWDGDSYEVLTNGTDVTSLLDDLVYRPTSDISDSPTVLLVLSVSDGDVSLPLTVNLHEMAPNREPATEVTIGGGDSPLTSGNSIEEPLPALQQSFIDGISVSGYANATIKVYTDFQDNPNDEPVPLAERDPNGWNGGSAGSQREQEVQVELIVDGQRFVIVAADTTEPDFEQSWFFDPETGLMTATVSYDQIYQLDGGGVVTSTTLADYLIDNPPSAGDVWTVSYDDNNGGSYQARTALFEFFFNDPGDPGVSSNGSDLADQMYGTSGNDVLTGGLGNDIIEGRGDGDVLIGGAGADELSGGAGEDVFRYLSTDDSGDLISDFSVGDDTLDFVALGVTAADLSVVNAGGSTEVTVNVGGMDLTLTLLNVALTQAEVAAASQFA